MHRETLEVVRTYYSVSIGIQEGVFRLLKSIALSSVASPTPDPGTNPVDRAQPASCQHLTQAPAVGPLSTEPIVRVWALQKVPGLPADFIQKVERRSDSQPVLRGHNARACPLHLRRSKRQAEFLGITSHRNSKPIRLEVLLETVATVLTMQKQPIDAISVLRSLR
jgi:hypothetical protein